MRHHHYHSPIKRGLFSFLLISSVMTIGTIGIHFIEGMSLLDSFYFMSMVATAQGPTMVPTTVAGKIFTSLMAFLSVGIVVASIGFVFGPFLGQLWRVGVERVEHLEEELHMKGREKNRPS